MDIYRYAKISDTAQFSLDILQIQYWKLVLAYQGEPNHTYMNGLNQINELTFA